MKKLAETRTQDGTLALHSRRKFLRRVLLTAAYMTPVVLSYSSAVFANHCDSMTCGGADHKMGMTFWSPGCSQL